MQVVLGGGTFKNKACKGVKEVELGKEKLNCNAIVAEASANPIGRPGVRMALRNHPKLWQGSQVFDTTPAGYWWWLLARSE